ncbi:FAD synthetase [Bacillus rubiinfantis]|uniref:FAD synthetase n=1 Tax=Bacillus rubiinfantis TaxID=1499680 RepID=UPI000AC4E468|nr:FAD synthetase [Bacillus rubiinfantis]
MEFYTPGILRLPASVVTIGALDGVHKGHQALLSKAKEQAEKFGVPFVVYTFDPPPKVFFKKGQMISTLEEKLKRIKALGANYVIVGRFNEMFMGKSVSSFIEELKLLNPVEIWEGPDFKFGKNRKGTIDDLMEHFTVNVLKALQCEQGELISSTRIRNLIQQGDYSLAQSLLGDISHLSSLSIKNYVI